MGRSTTTTTTRLLIKSVDLLERQRRCRCRSAAFCVAGARHCCQQQQRQQRRRQRQHLYLLLPLLLPAIARQSFESYQHNSDFSAFTLFLISRFASSFSVFVLFSFLFLEFTFLVQSLATLYSVLFCAALRTFRHFMLCVWDKSRVAVTLSMIYNTLLPLYPIRTTVTSRCV